MVLSQTAAQNKPRRRSIDKEEDTIAAIGLLQLRHYFYAKEQPNHPSFEDNRSTTDTTTTTTTSRKKSRSSEVKDRRISKTMNDQGRRTTRPRKKAEIKGSDKGFIVTTPHLKEEEEVKKRLRMGFVDKFKVQDDEESKSDDGSYITDDSSDMETTLAEISAAQQIVLLSKTHQQSATATTGGGGEEEESSSNRSSAGVVSSTTRRRKQDFEDESRRRRRKRKFRSLVDLYKITQPLV